MPPPPKQRKPRRFHPGTVALREIRRLQKTTYRLTPRSTFRRQLFDILSKLDVDEAPQMRISSLAVTALQDALEAYLIGILEDAHMMALHSRRVTVMQKDIDIAVKIRPAAGQ